MNKKHCVYFLLIMVLCMSVFVACSKNETNMPYGEYVNDECGSIVFDEDGIAFKNMDKELLINRYSSAMATLDYFEEKNEGIILTDDEMNELKKKYASEFDSERYSNFMYGYEFENNEHDYTVEFCLKDGNKRMFSLSYSLIDKNINFADKEFKIK